MKNTTLNTFFSSQENYFELSSLLRIPLPPGLTQLFHNKQPYVLLLTLRGDQAHHINTAAHQCTTGKSYEKLTQPHNRFCVKTSAPPCPLSLSK